jgi:hypothetical protein
MMEVECLERRRSLLIGIDLRDQSDVFTHDVLDRCDVYFKRDCFSPDLEALPEEVRHKVHPFGLNYACASASSRRKCVSAFAAMWLSAGLRSPRQFTSTVSRDLRALRAYVLSPDYDAFEQSPDVELEPLVLFQTRVWPPQATTEHLQEVNEQRAALVRTLRRELGQRFLGGLVPTEFARKHYSDVLTDLPSRRRWYPRVAKRGLIGIYTRGLHHSLAFKLPEYLAAAKCIVSQPLRNELPTPLVKGRNYLEFGSHGECVEHCERLLRDRALASGMRRTNYEYYESEVRPSAHMLKCLTRAFSGE